MSVDWKYKTFDIYYRGDQIICYWKKGKLRYISIGCEGDFASLAEVDEFWDSYCAECKIKNKNETNLS